jgi:ABC-type amino acid transport substrate-binding protein
MIDPATNEWVGTGPELGKELAQRLGVDYETVGTGWDGIVPGLPAGKHDIIITGLTYRPERDEVVDYVIMGEYGFCLLARADDDRVQNWDSFVDNPELVLCETTGTAEEHMITSEYPSINLRSMGADTVALWEEVLAERCDGDLVGSISVPIYIEMTEGKLKTAPEDCLDFPIFGKEWGHAVDEGDTAFYNWLQSTIDELEENGWLDELYDVWMQPEKLRMGLEVQ